MKDTVGAKYRIDINEDNLGTIVLDADATETVGTPLNKGTFLPDDVAQRHGLNPETALPKDVYDIDPDIVAKWEQIVGTGEGNLNSRILDYQADNIDIVESGKNGNWTYKKYSDGTFEAVGISIPSGVTASAYATFSGTTKLFLTGTNNPPAFSAMPGVTINETFAEGCSEGAGVVAGDGLLWGVYPRQTGAGLWAIYNTASSSISMQAKIHWKKRGIWT